MKKLFLLCLRPQRELSGQSPSSKRSSQADGGFPNHISHRASGGLSEVTGRRSALRLQPAMDGISSSAQAQTAPVYSKSHLPAPCGILGDQGGSHALVGTSTRELNSSDHEVLNSLSHTSNFAILSFSLKVAAPPWQSAGSASSTSNIDSAHDTEHCLGSGCVGRYGEDSGLDSGQLCLANPLCPDTPRTTPTLLGVAAAQRASAAGSHELLVPSPAPTIPDSLGHQQCASTSSTLRPQPYSWPPAPAADDDPPNRPSPDDHSISSSSGREEECTGVMHSREMWDLMFSHCLQHSDLDEMKQQPTNRAAHPMQRAQSRSLPDYPYLSLLPASDQQLGGGGSRAGGVGMLARSSSVPNFPGLQGLALHGGSGLEGEDAADDLLQTFGSGTSGSEASGRQSVTGIYMIPYSTTQSPGTGAGSPYVRMRHDIMARR